MIKYKAFVKVSELHSISKAADALGYSQPGLSHMLKRFEKEVGFPLFKKAKKSLEVTENGMRILPYCYEITEVERAMRDEIENINNNLTGAIRIGTPNSMLVGFVSYLVSTFACKYGENNLTIEEMSLEVTVKKLNENSVDVAFITDFAAGQNTFYPLMNDTVCLAVQKNNRLANYDKVPLSALRGEPLIMNVPGWDDISLLAIEQMNFKPNIKLYSASDVASLAMVQSNLGVYILSKLQKSIVPNNVVLREFEEDITRTVGIAVKSQKNLTALQREFVKFACNAFSDNIDSPPQF